MKKLDLPTDEEHNRLLELLGKDNNYYKKISWDSISKYYVLPIEVFREFKDKINWGLVSRDNNKSLSTETLIEFKDKIDWSSISNNRLLTVRELDIFKDKLDWQLISLFQPLPTEALDGRFDKYLIETLLEENITKNVKNRDWFLSYVSKDNFIRNKKNWYEYVTIFPRYFYGDYYKVLIFYKDIIMPTRAKIVYPIKEFKDNYYSYKRGNPVKSLYIEKLKNKMYEREIKRD